MEIPNAQEMLQHLLEQQPGNSRLQLVAQLMAQRNAAAQEADDEPEPKPSRERAARVAARVKRALDEMKAEIDALTTLTDDLAAALGACNLCWGEDRGCERCRGQGCSGYFEPDLARFSVLVRPAVVRLQRSRVSKPADAGKVLAQE